jgi:hypothetical protein
LIYFRAVDPNSVNYTTTILEAEWEPKLELLRPEEYTFVHAVSDNGIEFFAAYSVKFAAQK